MYADLVKCNNCLEEMKIERGGIICPKCCAIGTLSWLNDDSPEVECSINDIEKTNFHTYEPTDNQGHSWECTKCNHADSIYNDVVLSNVNDKHYDIVEEIRDIYNIEDGNVEIYTYNNTLFANICNNKNIDKHSTEHNLSFVPCTDGEGANIEPFVQINSNTETVF